MFAGRHSIGAAGLGGPTLLTFKTSANSVSNLSTYTFSSLSFSDTCPSGYDRYALAITHGSITSTGDSVTSVGIDLGGGYTSGVTVKGDLTTTPNFNSVGSGTLCAMFWVSAAAQTTASIRLTLGGTIGVAACGLYELCVPSGKTPSLVDSALAVSTGAALTPTATHVDAAKEVALVFGQCDQNSTYTVSGDGSVSDYAASAGGDTLGYGAASRAADGTKTDTSSISGDASSGAQGQVATIIGYT